MGRIAVEIIPRDEAGLRADIDVIKKYPQVDCVNIPDLMSFALRPWQAAEFTQPALPTIPHVRAMDIDLSKPLPMRDDFIRFGVKEVLIIAGDPPKDLTRTVYPTETIDVIRKFREELKFTRASTNIAAAFATNCIASSARLKRVPWVSSRSRFSTCAFWKCTPTCLTGTKFIGACRRFSAIAPRVIGK